LHKKKLYNLHSSPNTIRINSRRKRWAWNVASLGGRKVHIGIEWESQKEIEHREDEDVGQRIMLRWV
jgi:hypothetical protein